MQADAQTKNSINTRVSSGKGLSWEQIFKWQLVVGAFALLVLVGCYGMTGYNIYQVAARRGELLKLISMLDASEFVVTVTKYVHQVLIPVTILPTIPVIVFGIGGIARRQRGCITLFSFFLFVFAAIILGVGIAIYSSEQQYLELFSLSKPSNYGLVEEVTDKYDHAHLTWSCCGRQSPADFQSSICTTINTTCQVEILAGLRVPLTCCINITRCEHSRNHINDPLIASSLINNRGCASVIENAVLTRYRLISVSLIILGVLMLMTTICSCCLHHSIVLSKERALLYDMGIVRTKDGYQPSQKLDSVNSIEEIHPMEKLLTKRSSYTTSRSRPSLGQPPEPSRKHSSHSYIKRKISIPMSALIDPDTEISESSPTPFDKLVVIPIQELGDHKHRVRTISLKNAHKSITHRRSHGNMRQRSSRDVQSADNLYTDRRMRSMSDADFNNSNSSEESWERLTEYTYTSRDESRREPHYSLPVRRRRIRRRRVSAPPRARSQSIRRHLPRRRRIRRRGHRRPPIRL